MTVTVIAEKGNTMTELKPCRCGSDKVHILHTDLGIGWACLVGCLNIVCDESVVRYGLTKKQAERRAVRAWNRRVKNA